MIDLAAGLATAITEIEINTLHRLSVGADHPDDHVNVNLGFDGVAVLRTVEIIAPFQGITLLGPGGNVLRLRHIAFAGQGKDHE